MRQPLPLIRSVLGLLVLAGLVVATEDPLPFPEMAPTVGLHLERDYYDHARFQPLVMVERALRTLEEVEVSIKTGWQDGVIELTIADRSRRIPAPKPATLAAAMIILEQVRLAVEEASFTPVRRRELAYSLINGALRCLDPHTVMMPPEQAKEFREDLAAEFYGIGAFLNQEEGVISIERVMPELPAERANVQDGDVILAIDGEMTAGLSLEQAVKRIKGPKGTPVTLTVVRKGAPAPIDITIVRDLVQVITIRSYRSGEVAYVRMDEFNQNTAKDLFKCLVEVQKSGPLKAFVLDLRFNGGGLLDQARMISDFFLPKGEEIVRIVSAQGDPIIHKSSSRQILAVPMVVMVSGGSASAAEILSGALQCNDRAVVAGTTTFGKGSVQTVKDLVDGSRLKLTIQGYQLAGGFSIQDVGVTPDLRLVQHFVRQDGTLNLVPFSGSREADDEFALRNQHAYQHPTTYELGWLAKHLSKEESKKSSISSREFVPDQEASLVIDLLLEAVAQPDFTEGATLATASHSLRQFLLERLCNPVATRAKAEAAALAALLAQRTPSIVWGPAVTVKAGELNLAYTGPASVTAGETAALTFTVANATVGEVGRLYGVVQADKYSPLWDSEVMFGAVPAGGTTTGAMAFKVPPRLYAGEERFQVDLFRDGQTDRLASVPVRLAIQAQPRPHFGYRWRLDEPGGDGQLNPGEAAAVQLTLHNDGQGPSAKIDLRVFKDNDPFVQLGETRYKLDPLPKDGTVTVRVPLTVLKEKEGRRGDQPVPFSAEAIKLIVRAEERFDDEIDGRYRGSLFHILTIPVNAPVNPHPIVQPTLTVAGMERSTSDQVKLSVKAADDHLRFVTVFVNDDKVAILPAAQLPADGIFTIPIAIKPGLNAVRVLAVDADEVSDHLPLRLWGDELPATAAKPPEAKKTPEPPRLPAGEIP
jgi:carboxyl-terminal processing protease